VDSIRDYYLRATLGTLSKPCSVMTVSELRIVERPQLADFTLCCFCHFGQPSAGFFLDRDFFTRAFQSPLSFNLSALGPGVAFFLEWFELFATFFLFTSFNILSLRKWVLVHQSLTLGCFHSKNGTFTIVQLPMVPHHQLGHMRLQ